MAEANQNQQGAGQQGNVQPQQGTGQGQQPQQGQVQEPKWLSYVPEAEREDARKSYLLHSDYTKKTQEVADQRKAFEQSQKEWKEKYEWLPKWYEESYRPFYDKYGKALNQNWQGFESNWDKIQALLGGQQQPQPQQRPQQSPQVSEDAYANWDLLPPQEQFKRVAEYTNQHVNENLQALLQQQEQKMNQGFQSINQGAANLLNTVFTVLDKLNPDAPVKPSDLIKAAAEFKPEGTSIDWAYDKLTSQTQKDKLIKETEERIRKEMEQEFQNRQQSNGALVNEGVPHFKVKPKTPSEIRSAVSQMAREKGFGWGR